VNYRFWSPYYIVDRLFGAAELRLGADKGDIVRIERTDGQTELYNVDRISKSEGLDALPTDYSKLPPSDIPVLGPPLPGDLGPAIVNAQQPVVVAYTVPSYDPNDALRKEVEAATASSVFLPHQ